MIKIGGSEPKKIVFKPSSTESYEPNILNNQDGIVVWTKPTTANIMVISGDTLKVFRTDSKDPSYQSPCFKIYSSVNGSHDTFYFYAQERNQLTNFNINISPYDFITKCLGLAIDDTTNRSTKLNFPIYFRDKWYYYGAFSAYYGDADEDEYQIRFYESAGVNLDPLAMVTINTTSIDITEVTVGSTGAPPFPPKVSGSENKTVLISTAFDAPLTVDGYYSTGTAKVGRCRGDFVTTNSNVSLSYNEAEGILTCGCYLASKPSFIGVPVTYGYSITPQVFTTTSSTGRDEFTPSLGHYEDTFYYEAIRNNKDATTDYVSSGLSYGGYIRIDAPMYTLTINKKTGVKSITVKNGDIILTNNAQVREGTVLTVDAKPELNYDLDQTYPVTVTVTGDTEISPLAFASSAEVLAAPSLDATETIVTNADTGRQEYQLKINIYNNSNMIVNGHIQLYRGTSSSNTMVYEDHVISNIPAFGDDVAYHVTATSQEYKIIGWVSSDAFNSPTTTIYSQAWEDETTTTTTTV